MADFLVAVLLIGALLFAALGAIAKASKEHNAQRDEGAMLFTLAGACVIVALGVAWFA